jgi:hypothetical protein
MEQVAHGVHEDEPGLTPVNGLFQALRSELKIKAVFVWVA